MRLALLLLALHRPCSFNSPTPAWTQFDMQQTAVCVADRWNISLPKLRSVIDCESNWYRFARNGDYRGLAQHDIDYWPARVRAFDSLALELKESIYNPRTQLIVTAKMAAGSGWGAWACA